VFGWGGGRGRGGGGGCGGFFGLVGANAGNLPLRGVPRVCNTFFGSFLAAIISREVRPQSRAAPNLQPTAVVLPDDQPGPGELIDGVRHWHRAK